MTDLASSMPVAVSAPGAARLIASRGVYPNARTFKTTLGDAIRSVALGTVQDIAATSYTLQATDLNGELRFSATGPVALTIGAAVAGLDIGSMVFVMQLGANGFVTVSGANGVTIVSPGSPRTRDTFTTVVLIKQSALVWSVEGDTSS